MKKLVQFKWLLNLKNQCLIILNTGTPNSNPITPFFCFHQQYDFATNEIRVYDFCYDVNRNRMLYVGDYIVTQPKLLNSKLLFRERNIQHHMTILGKLIPSNYLDLETAVNNVS